MRAKTAPDLRGAPAPAPGKGMFLVASRSLRDPNFARSVVLLLEYGESGAMGVVVNRPTSIDLARVLPQLAELKERLHRVYVRIGGPVERNRLVLLLHATEQPEQATHVVEDIYVTASLATLRHVLEREDPDGGFQAYAGYAGWAPGQLESELARGDWRLSPADAETVFEREPSEMWDELIRQTSGRWVRQGGDHERPASRAHSATAPALHDPGASRG